MRKLVTIRTVSEVREIPGADQIEVVQLDGWQCVVKKGSLKVGDACVYFEVDSFLPIEPRYAFMAGRGEQTNGDGSKGYRLRTIKLRKTLSQGLALPLDDFPFLNPEDIGPDDDIAAMIGVTKFEPPMPAQLCGQAKGTFPAFLKKTDQERIQNMPWILEDDGEWEVTQKLNGSSCTVFHRDGEFGVCSRNMELKETEGNSFWSVANRYGMRDMLERIGLNIALQGELIGPSIQGNSHGLMQPDFYLFDIWMIDESRHANPEERAELFDVMRPFGIKHAPIINILSLGRIGSVDKALKYAEERIDILNPKNPAPEGVVFKKMDGSQSFKVISNKHLLKAA